MRKDTGSDAFTQRGSSLSATDAVTTRPGEALPDRLPWPLAALVILGLSLVLWFGLAWLL